VSFSIGWDDLWERVSLREGAWAMVPLVERGGVVRADRCDHVRRSPGWELLRSNVARRCVAKPELPLLKV
jgi:hypothetical protein